MIYNGREEIITLPSPSYLKRGDESAYQFAGTKASLFLTFNVTQYIMEFIKIKGT